MNKQRGYINVTSGDMFFGLAIVGFLGWLFFGKLLPWVWSFVGPWLHAVTA